MPTLSADEEGVSDATSLARPYMRGAVTTVGPRGEWPRSFVVSYSSGPRRWRAEFTLNTDGAAMFQIEDVTRGGMVDPPLIGWLSWREGEVVTAFRNLATGSQGGAILPDSAPADDGPLTALGMDVERWTALAQELTSAARDAEQA